MSFKLDDSYVDVAERIRLFYQRFPDGRLTRLGEPEIREVGGKVFVLYTALAYRAIDDTLPAIGTAWEPFPGPTQFTRDSELMNAETAAWGRAIIAAGIPSKRIASAQEVQSRQSPPLPPEPIGKDRAAELLLNSDSAGIDRQALRKAVSHATQGDVDSLEDDEAAVSWLALILPEQEARVARWVERKRAQVPA